MKKELKDAKDKQTELVHLLMQHDDKLHEVGSTIENLSLNQQLTKRQVSGFYDNFNECTLTP